MSLTKAGAAELAAYLLLAGLLGYLSLESELASPAWAVLLLGLGGVATILLRQRLPLVTLVVAPALMLLSAAAGSMAEALPVVAALLYTGVAESARRAWALFGATIAAGTAAALVLAVRVRTGPPFLGLSPRAEADAWALDWLSLGSLFATIALIATLIGVNVGHRRRHMAALVDRAERMRRERDQQADMARALERERISREMHDVIAHSLSVMIALADGARVTVPERRDEAQRIIGQIADTGRRTLGEVRRLLSTATHGETVSERPLGVTELPRLVDEFVEAGLPVRLERSGELGADTAVGLTIYRIVQESLTNALRHAKDVRNVLVRLELSESAATILVEDDAAPAIPSESPGRGLVGIRERVALYDGDVEAGPRDGGGWRVFVRLRTEGS